MFSRIAVIFLLLCMLVSIECAEPSENQTEVQSKTVAVTYPKGCSPDDETGLNTSALVTLGVIATFQIIFSIVVAVTVFFILSKMAEKMREAETHLHQVMDATLCALFPQSVITEINAVAEEAQMQNKKGSSKRGGGGGEENKEKTNKSAAKSPAQKE